MFCLSESNIICYHSTVCGHIDLAPDLDIFYYQQSTVKPLIAELINGMLSELKTRRHLH